MSQICSRFRDRVQLQSPTALHRIDIIQAAESGRVTCPQSLSGIGDGEFVHRKLLLFERKIHTADSTLVNPVNANMCGMSVLPVL